MKAKLLHTEEVAKVLGVSRRTASDLMRDGRYHFGQVDDGYKNFLHCMAIYNAMQAEIR